MNNLSKINAHYEVNAEPAVPVMKEPLAEIRMSAEKLLDKFSSEILAAVKNFKKNQALLERQNYSVDQACKELIDEVEKLWATKLKVWKKLKY